jgi:regulatory protein YycI of two-component signal transduction system YycFG
MNNETRNILIVVIAVLALVIGAYYFGTSANKQTETVSNTQDASVPATTTNEVPQSASEQPVVKQAAPQPTANIEPAEIATTDELLTCSNQAKTLFATHSSAIPPSMMSDSTFTYKDHFNVTDGKCYSVETYNGSSSFGESLWDVYENNNIANYNLTNANAPSGQCLLNGVSGCSKTQFDTYLNSKMESSTY